MREVDQWEDRREQFSREGWRALFRYIDAMDDETGTESELDIIAFCCEFSEFENLEDFQKQYGVKYQTMEDIEDETAVIPIEGTKRFIISQF